MYLIMHSNTNSSDVITWKPWKSLQNSNLPEVRRFGPIYGAKNILNTN